MSGQKGSGRMVGEENKVIIMASIRPSQRRLTKDVSRQAETTNRFSCLKPGLDWTRLFMSLTAGAGTRCSRVLSHLQAYFLIKTMVAGDRNCNVMSPEHRFPNKTALP